MCGVLSGDDDGQVDILDGHLGLTVWAQPPASTVLANVSDFLSDGDVFSRIARVPERDALVIGVHIEVIVPSRCPPTHWQACCHVRRR